jgi:proteasome alpha subunit
MQPRKEAYDRASIIFSPDGRLFQVEYAQSAVKKGATAVGLKFKNGAVLIVDKRITSRLMNPSYIEKISKLANHIGCASSGLIADARIIIEKARLAACINEITYGEKIQVRTLVKNICDFKNSYTQYASVRPFGVSFLTAGVDEKGAHLFATGPSGVFRGYKSHCEGKGQKAAMIFLENNYNEKITKNEAISLGIKALFKGAEETINPDAIEIATVDSEKLFNKLSQDELKKYVIEAIG